MPLHNCDWSWKRCYARAKTLCAQYLSKKIVSVSSSSTPHFGLSAGMSSADAQEMHSRASFGTFDVHAHTHTHTEGETAGNMLPSLNDLFSCRLWSCWLPLSWRSSLAPACRSAPLSSFLEAPPRVARLPVVCRSASQRGWRVMWLPGSPFASPGSKKSGIVVCLWNHTKTQTKRK